MTEPSLVSQGVELMVFGMGVVFVFLTMLVFVTMLMSKIANKLAPAQPEPAAVPMAPAAQGVDPQLLKVLAAAVQQHRNRR